MTALFSFTDFHHRRSGPRSAPFAAAILVFATASMASAQQSFKSAGEAADALAGAARTGNQRSILAVVGQPGADVVSSGDEVADTATLKIFLAAYDTRHRVVVEANKATMLVGDEDFPFPIPIVRSGQTWRFDTAAGRLEVLYRRIGRNEQDEYADKDRTGAGPGLYAQHFVNGLYWPDSSGNDPSPLGELVAQATGEGYRIGAGRTPFHGYYYKILTKQGSTAPGGALDYVVNGKMLGGFGLVAYPAEYGNSGVMTFLVNYNGVIFQKDLGPRTSWRAERITSFNPDQKGCPRHISLNSLSRWGEAPADETRLGLFQTGPRFGRGVQFVQQ
jgi:hypothetical protein